MAAEKVLRTFFSRFAPPLGEKGVFYGWWIVLACALINLCVGSFFYGFSFFLEPITKHLQVTYAATSVAFSLRSIEAGFAAPVAGFLSDRFGPKRLLFAGAVVGGLGFIFLSTVNSLGMFYFAFIVLSLGMSACSPVVMMTAVANWFHKKVGLAMGLMMVGVGMSGLLLPVISWLVGTYHWDTTLIIMGVGLMAVALPLSFVVRHKPEPYGYLPDGEEAPKTEGASSQPIAEAEFAPIEALKSRAFWTISLALSVQFMVVSAVVLHVKHFYTTIDIPALWMGWLTGAIPIMSIVGRLGLGRLGDIIDKRYVLALCFGLQALGMAFLTCAGNVWGVLLFLLFFSPGYGGSIPLRAALQRDYFGRSAFGTIQGMMMGVMTVGGIIGPWLAGHVFDTRGSYQSIWLAFAITSALVVPFVFLIQRPRQA